MKIISLTFLLSSLLVLSCSVHKSYGLSRKDVLERLIQAYIENAEHQSNAYQDLVNAQLNIGGDSNWHTDGQYYYFIVIAT